MNTTLLEIEALLSLVMKIWSAVSDYIEKLNL